jgi:hypothetical protein
VGFVRKTYSSRNPNEVQRIREGRLGQGWHLPELRSARRGPGGPHRLLGHRGSTAAGGDHLQRRNTVRVDVTVY